MKAICYNNLNIGKEFIIDTCDYEYLSHILGCFMIIDINNYDINDYTNILDLSKNTYKYLKKLCKLYSINYFILFSKNIDLSENLLYRKEKEKYDNV